jgi:hypothetical protein
MKRSILFFLSVLVFAGLACGVPGLSEENREQIRQAATTAAQAAETAGNVAATAQAFAENEDNRATARAAAQQAATMAARAATSGQEAVEALRQGGFDANYLREKFADAVVVDVDGNNITLTVTEAELNAAVLLSQQEAIASGENPSVTNLQVRFTSGTVIFTGQITQPVEGQMQAVFEPLLVDMMVNGELIGRELRFELLNATVGTVQVPAYVINLLEARLNSTLVAALGSLPENVVLDEVTVGEGVMTIRGHYEGIPPGVPATP